MRPVKFNDFVSEVNCRQSEFEEAFKRVLKSGWFILGPEVTSFEEKLAEYLKVKNCVGVGNGLEALQISLMALGIKNGDEVITTPISAIATVLAILAVGAKPIFVDTDSSGLMNVDLIEPLITKETKAVLPVHLYGNAVNLTKLKDICKKYDLYLIEDACQAHGSSYKGKKLGTIGDIGCYSFYPTKNLGAFGDGGAIVTNNNKLANICRQIRDYGQVKRYKHNRYGLNSRLDELHAALLKVRLRYLEEDNNKRRAFAKRYLDKLGTCSSIEIISQQPLEDANFHLFVIKSKQRDELQKYLKEQGIPTLIHYPQIISNQSFLKKRFHSAKLKDAQSFVKEVLSLPCHPQMDEEQVDYICQKIINFFQNRGR